MQRVRRNSSELGWTAAICPSRRMCAVLLLTVLGFMLPGLSVLLILASHPDIQCDINSEVRQSTAWRGGNTTTANWSLLWLPSCHFIDTGGPRDGNRSTRSARPTTSAAH
jgi:hypothetical protein